MLSHTRKLLLTWSKLFLKTVNLDKVSSEEIASTSKTTEDFPIGSGEDKVPEISEKTTPEKVVEIPKSISDVSTVSSAMVEGKPIVDLETVTEMPKDPVPVLTALSPELTPQVSSPTFKLLVRSFLSNFS